MTSRPNEHPPSTPAAPGNAAGALPRAQDFAAKRDWPGYFKVVLGKPPRDTLLSALARFESDGVPPKRATQQKGTRFTVSSGAPLAVDLGCGEGRDTLELLRRGWRVLAIDGHPQAFELLLPRVPTEDRPRLTTSHAPFETAQWPRCTLFNSSFSLPFCDPARFDEVWNRIGASIEPGGRFAGQLFGDRDDWAVLPDRSHQTEQQARALLDRARLEIEEFKVDEKQESDAMGNPKKWHVFHIVARKL